MVSSLIFILFSLIVKPSFAADPVEPAKKQVNDYYRALYYNYSDKKRQMLAEEICHHYTKFDTASEGNVHGAQFSIRVFANCAQNKLKKPNNDLDPNSKERSRPHWTREVCYDDLPETTEAAEGTMRALYLVAFNAHCKDSLAKNPSFKDPKCDALNFESLEQKGRIERQNYDEKLKASSSKLAEDYSQRRRKDSERLHRLIKNMQSKRVSLDLRELNRQAKWVMSVANCSDVAVHHGVIESLSLSLAGVISNLEHKNIELNKVHHLKGIDRFVDALTANNPGPLGELKLSNDLLNRLRSRKAEVLQVRWNKLQGQKYKPGLKESERNSITNELTRVTDEQIRVLEGIEENLNGPSEREEKAENPPAVEKWIDSATVPQLIHTIRQLANTREKVNKVLAETKSDGEELGRKFSSETFESLGYLQSLATGQPLRRLFADRGLVIQILRSKPKPDLFDPQHLIAMFYSFYHEENIQNTKLAANGRMGLFPIMMDWLKTNSNEGLAQLFRPRLQEAVRMILNKMPDAGTAEIASQCLQEANPNLKKGDAPKTMTQTPKPPKKGFWARLFGRN